MTAVHDAGTAVLWHKGHCQTCTHQGQLCEKETGWLNAICGNVPNDAFDKD